MLPIKILPQPDEITCGPTCLHAIYNYYGDDVALSDVIAQVPSLEEGGTLAVMLACHALKRGYEAVIYTYNLHVFDPSWFMSKKINIADKLREQLKYKPKNKLRMATSAYLEFLSLGGELRFEDLNASLLKRFFKDDRPILTGLSSTYLYKSAREFVLPDRNSVPNDVKGYPQGHFVVLCGYDFLRRNIIVADPYVKNTISGDNYYSVRLGRLINSIMLGIITYDANFLIIKPKKGK